MLVALRLPGVDVHEVMQVHRRYVVELMQQWTRLKEDAAEHDVGLALVVDAELFRLDSVIRWLDAADGRLKRGSRADPPAPPAARRRLPRLRRTVGSAAMSASRAAAACPRCTARAPTEVHALRGVDLSVDAGRAGRGHGPERLGQEHAADHRRQPRGADQRRGARSAASRVGACRATTGPGCGAARSATCSRTSTCWPGSTAVENVSLPLELDGVGAARRAVAGLEALEELGLGDRASRFPDELSGGERQRVAIARAVVGDRRLLLADEPSGALDSVNGEAVMRLMRAACQRGVAGVVVTHDAQLASWADRVVFLRDGRVVDQTAPPAGPESLLAPASNS